MKIDTKFNIGDTAWTIIGNKVKEFRITGFRVSVIGQYVPEIGFPEGLFNNEIVYIIGFDYSTEIPESKLFKTKKELLESL